MCGATAGAKFCAARKHPRWGSNPQPPAPETDALPLRHAGISRDAQVKGPDTRARCLVCMPEKFRHRELNPGLLGEGQVF